MEELSQQKRFETVESPIKEAYELLGAHNPLELSQLYTKEDQKLMKSQNWDYNNDDLVINKVKNILENVDESNLTNEEKEWRKEILWFWYHHAISCAIYRYKDKEAAKKYSITALQHKEADHPNKITDIFNLLLDNRVSEAEQLAEGMEHDKQTAAELIQEYKDGKMF